MNNVVQSVDCLTGREVKRFYEDGLIKSSGGDFWLRDGGTDLNPGRAGMFSEVSEQVCTCDARAERVQFRPAIRLNNGGITQGIHPGDVLEFTNPLNQNKYKFTFLGVGDDNHFVALADEPVCEMAFSKSRNNDAYDYDKSDVKKLADERVLVNIRTYDCELIKTKKQEYSRYEDEQAIVDELKGILDGANPSFMSVAFGKEISAKQMVHDAVYYLTPVVPEEILADKTYTGASCQPFTTFTKEGYQIAGIAQMYGFEEEPPYAPSTVTEIYELSEDSIATLVGYAHNIINEKYSDIAALEPVTLKKIDGYVINPEAADRKLREDGQGEFADKLKEAYGWNEQKPPRAVKKNYIELIRDLAPVFEGEDKKIEQEV